MSITHHSLTPSSRLYPVYVMSPQALHNMVVSSTSMNHKTSRLSPYVQAPSYDGDAPVNLGAGMEITIRGLTELVARLTGFSSEIRWDVRKPNGQPRRHLDTTRAARLFGFRARTSFEEGLRRTVEWYFATPAASQAA
jgi:hypothetical protein